MDPNPYAPPQSDLTPTIQQKKFGALFGLFFTGIAASAVFGAITNAVNGAVSPLYFSNIMYWPIDERIWHRAVFQGVIEGIAYGFVFSAIYVITVAKVSKASCQFLLGVKYFLAIIFGTLCTWICGGIIAIIWVVVDMDSYRMTFYEVPEPFEDCLRNAWVGGSIWGAVYGGMAVLFFVCRRFVTDWHTGQQNSSAVDVT